MRGHGQKSVTAENLTALRPLLDLNQETNARKMCWKCQKEKRTKGGSLKLFAGGPMKFICKECMDAKKEKQHGLQK
jgi:hypothetical protein